MSLNVPHIPSDAESVYDDLRAAHIQFVAQADSEADLPAWYVLTSAGPIRIRTIGKFRSFVQFVTDEGTVLLAAPEVVAVMMQRLPPESAAPRFPIGFRSGAQEVVAPSDD